MNRYVVRFAFPMQEALWLPAPVLTDFQRMVRTGYIVAVCLQKRHLLLKLVR